MKLLLLLFFYLPAQSDSLYNWTHNKMKEIFGVEYRDDIIFNQTRYLDNWNCAGRSEPDLLGVFDNMYVKDQNNIWLLNYSSDLYGDNYHYTSFLIHEYAHFFSKKAGFNENFDGKTQVYDKGLTEAIAYFIQDLWFKRAYRTWLAELLLSRGRGGRSKFNNIR